MKKIGLLGGAFDPPHIGHLIIAEEAYQQLDLDEVWFIPTYQSPHKSNTETPVEHRLEMVEKAIAGNNHFSLNKIEVERQGISYTYQTIESLKEDYPETQFYFIIGGDMVEYLPKWNRIEELLEKVQFVGVTRPGFGLETDLNIMEVNIPGFDISSSMIRDRLQSKKTARYLVPDSVLELIKEFNLYE